MLFTILLCSFLCSIAVANNISADTNLVPIASYLSHDFQPITPCGLSFVDACFVINLDYREDRWAYMQQIGTAEGVAFTRVPAVYGAQLPANIGSLLGRHYSRSHQRYIAMNRNQLGCLLSHLSVLYKAEQLNLHSIWVFEDDIVLETSLSNVQNLLHSIEAELGSDSWDIIYTDRRTKQVYADTRCFEPVKVRCGTYSMLISAAGRRKILDYYQTAGVLHPIDWELGCIASMRLFQPTNNLVTFTREFGSDIKLKRKWQWQHPSRSRQAWKNPMHDRRGVTRTI